MTTAIIIIVLYAIGAVVADITERRNDMVDSGLYFLSWIQVVILYRRIHLRRKAVEATEIYTCPTCGNAADDKSIVYCTKPRIWFESWQWTEVHKCGYCKTVYKLNNGT